GDPVRRVLIIAPHSCAVDLHQTANNLQHPDLIKTV
ncbi:hypothetical protein A2U01_0113365, partial [Trifolium medium]|nr:hypothetical protein [Trifolium medium]